MKKVSLKMVIAVALLIPLLWAVSGQAETIRVGSDAVSRAFLDPNFDYSQILYSNIAVVDHTHRIPVDGKVTQFEYYAANTNPFHFMLLDKSLFVRWISEPIRPPAPGINTYTLSEPFSVESRGYIGAYLLSGITKAGTIPFDYHASSEDGDVMCLYDTVPILGSYFEYNDISNRSYSFNATVVTDEPQPGQTAQVSLVKYLDGAHATEGSALGNRFPLIVFSGTNEGVVVKLGPVGVNTDNPYEAKSAVMPVGSFYSVAEDTTQGAVGPNCGGGQFSRLVGYTVGDTLDQAIGATLTAAGPSFTGIDVNKYVIVWNQTCKYVNVTVVKYLDGQKADAVSALNNSFPITAEWRDEGGSGTTDFALGPVGVNTDSPYEAQSYAMASGASYRVTEGTSTDAVATACTTGKFSRLLGYSTGNTLEEALSAARTATAPNLTNIVSNQTVIVWNETCQADDDDDDPDCSRDNGHHYGNDKGDNHESPQDNDGNKNGKAGGKR